MGISEYFSVPEERAVERPCPGHYSEGDGYF